MHDVDDPPLFDGAQPLHLVQRVREHALHAAHLVDDGQLAVLREGEDGLDAERAADDGRRRGDAPAALQIKQVVRGDHILEVQRQVGHGGIRLVEGVARVAAAHRLIDQLALADRGRERVHRFQVEGRIFLFDILRRTARHMDGGREAARDGEVQHVRAALPGDLFEMRVVRVVVEHGRARGDLVPQLRVKVQILCVIGKSVEVFTHDAVLFHRERERREPHVMRAHIVRIQIGRRIGRHDKFRHKSPSGPPPFGDNKYFSTSIS